MIDVPSRSTRVLLHLTQGRRRDAAAVGLLRTVTNRNSTERHLRGPTRRSLEIGKQNGPTCGGEIDRRGFERDNGGMSNDPSKRRCQLDVGTFFALPIGVFRQSHY